MTVTKRDIEFLKFINDCGFCDMEQLMKRFEIKKSRLYEILQRLREDEFIRHHQIFHRNVVFTVTAKGAKYTDLPPVHRISRGRYEHQIALTNVYIKLQQQYPDGFWMSERKLKRDKFYDGLGKSGHLADGMFIFPGGKLIAVEVEISAKGKSRIEQIIKEYASQFDISEVWYFCLPAIIPILTSLTEKMPFIKTTNLIEFLHDSK